VGAAKYHIPRAAGEAEAAVKASSSVEQRGGCDGPTDVKHALALGLVVVLLAACARNETPEDLAKRDLECVSVHVFPIGEPEHVYVFTVRTCQHRTLTHFHVEGCDRSRNYVCYVCEGGIGDDDDPTCEGDGPVIE
jgi:hypothetical protein